MGRKMVVVGMVVVFVVFLVGWLVGMSGSGETKTDDHGVIASGSYTSDSLVKLVWWKDISAAQKRGCMVLQVGQRERRVNIVVVNVGMDYTVWRLSEDSFQRFATPAFGDCYGYQGRYYYVAFP